MDTKLKNYKGPRAAVCYISTVISVISITASISVGCMLALAYNLNYAWLDAENKMISDVISQLWAVEVPAVLLAVTTLIIAIWKVGARDGEGKIRLNWFDRLFTDLQIAGGGLAVFFTVYLTLIHVDVWVRSDWYDKLLHYFTKEQLKQYQQDGYRVYDSWFEHKWLESFFAFFATYILVA